MISGGRKITVENKLKNLEESAVNDKKRWSDLSWDFSDKNFTIWERLWGNILIGSEFFQKFS